MSYVRHPILLVLVPFVLAGALLGGCGGDDNDPNNDSSALPSGAVARVGDTMLPRAELQRRVDILRAALKANGQAVTPALKRQLLDGMIYAEWLEQEATKEHVLPPQTDIRRELQRRASRVGEGIPNPDGDIVFEKNRAQHVRLDLLTKALIAKASKNAPKATNTEIARYYESKKADFQSRESRDVYLVATRDKADAVAAIRAVKSGTSWPDAVDRYSQEGVAMHGDGRVSLSDDSFEPTLVRAIFTAPLHRPLGPVNVDRAWYVFEVLAAFPKRTAPLYQVRESIAQVLDNKARDEIAASFTTEMRDKYTGQTTCAADVKLDLCGNES